MTVAARDLAADRFFARGSRPTIQDRRAAGAITTQATAVAERLLGLTPWSNMDTNPNTVTVSVDLRALRVVLALAEQTLRAEGLDDTDESRTAWNATQHVADAALAAGLAR